MKMYILLKESVPDAFAPVIAAHASLACFRKFEHEPEMQTWINGIFRKVVCQVTDAEFEKARVEPKCLVLTESALDNVEVGLAFCPREEYPKRFQYFRKWRPK